MEIPFQGLDGEGHTHPPPPGLKVRTSAAPSSPIPPLLVEPGIRGGGSGGGGEKTGLHSLSQQEQQQEHEHGFNMVPFSRMLTTVVTIQTGTPVVLEHVSNCY